MEAETSRILDELSDDEYRELHNTWLSRLMFNMFVRWPSETRAFEEFVLDYVKGT